MAKQSSKNQSSETIGARTRAGRSGLDPIENSKEAAYLEGLFLRKLLTGQLRTNDPIYLIFIAMAGVFALLFPLLGVVGKDMSIVGQWGRELGSVVPAGVFCWPVGILLLFNVIMSTRVNRNRVRRGKH